MAFDPWGFLTYRREDALVRPIDERVRDWRVVSERPSPTAVERNARRCMDCGVPFCEFACPLGNRIPTWNELVAERQWRRGIEQLHATNNFPEFTGWLCPAPCEASCVLSLNDDPVAIRQIELALIDHAFDQGWIRPQPTARPTGHRAAVIGSGPAGLAAAQQLTRAGHEVTVFERSDRLGGLLRYGIPDFKMEKALIDRRLAQMEGEGTRFVAGVDVGVDVIPDELAAFDAVILACGASLPRLPEITGRAHPGVVWGVDYLVGANRAVGGQLESPPIDARGRRVVIIGGGDTAIDCLGTANRQGAASVHVLDHNLAPPEQRDHSTNPWPQWPKVHKHTFAHEEGVNELWQAQVTDIVQHPGGGVCAVRGRRVRPVTGEGGRRFEPLGGDDWFELGADLVLLATGFAGVEPSPLITALGVELAPSGTVAVDAAWRTNRPGVYACGDATRGASLVVWAIADGRACASAVHRELTGDAFLPCPVTPGSRPV